MMVHTLTGVSPAPLTRAGWGRQAFGSSSKVTTPTTYLRLQITDLYKSTFTSTSAAKFICGPKQICGGEESEGGDGKLAMATSQY